MIPDSNDHPIDADEGHGCQGVRTLSDAKAWLAKMAEKGAAQVQIKEPYRVIGGGLLAVTASLVREDGARVNIEVYCYDDRPCVPPPVDLFPPPSAAAMPGVN